MDKSQKDRDQKVYDQLKEARKSISYHSSFLPINDGKWSFMYLAKKNKIKLPKISHYKMWDELQQSQFIESILLDYPIPTIILSEYKDYQEIIKGSEYIMALTNFLYDQLELTGLTKLTSLNGFKYSDLPSFAKSYLNNSSLYVNIIEFNKIPTKADEVDLLGKLGMIYY